MGKIEHRRLDVVRYQDVLNQSTQRFDSTWEGVEVSLNDHQVAVEVFEADGRALALLDREQVEHLRDDLSKWLDVQENVDEQ